MKKQLATFSPVLILCLILSACGPGQLPEPTLTPTLAPTVTSIPTVTPTPTATAAPTSRPTPTLIPMPDAANNIEMQCEDWAVFNNGEFQAQNNTWGKGELTNWSQCIGMTSNPDGSLAARWTWDWPQEGTGVKSYPEVVFGQKPGGPTTSPSLPLRLDQIASARVDYDAISNTTGKYNLAFDLWLTDTDNPDTWGSPPITHEVMIWVDGFGKMSPGGSMTETIEIDNVSYMVFVARNWGSGWTYIAFVSREPLYGEQTIEIANFLSYMTENGLASGEEYLASIEFGNEVVYGTGDTYLSRYEIAVVKK